jgi:hypothetical protein
MWIMLAGPCRSGGTDAAKRAEHLRLLNAAALAMHRLGHIPVVGVDMAPPVIAAAGRGDAACEEIMMPVPLALAKRCDARLRSGGPSKGADGGAERFMAAGRRAFRDTGEIPSAVRT